MKYEVTKELETGNALIDSEHRQLFQMVNNLQDACAQGKGRAQIESSVKFLMDYVKKHFNDEESLQKQYKYPGYDAHHKFHQGYMTQIDNAGKELLSKDADIASLAEVNRLIGILISHIRTEDKKIASHIHAIDGK